MTVITGSYLSNLAYCEYKAVLSQEHPTRRPKPPSRKVLEKVIGEAGIRATVEVIHGTVEGVEVAISPGALLYRDDNVYGILRPSLRGVPRVYEGDFAPLKAAALLLDMQGMVKGILRLVVVVGADTRALEEALHYTIIHGLKPGRGEGWVASTRVYTREEAERILSRAVRIAKNRALARPSPSPAKCGACEYSAQCIHSMANR